MQLQQEQLLWMISMLLMATAVHLCDARLKADEYLGSYTSTDELAAPLIIPTSSDITLEPYTNFTLQCESERPVKWEIADVFDIILRYKTEKYTTHNPTRPYGSSLTLYDVTAENVRYYYCIDENVELTNDFDNANELEELIPQFKASKIYIFVNDLDNLLVPHGHPIIIANHYSDVIIPCKPTSKDIDVEITNPQDETFSSDESSKYDPKIGFIVKLLHIHDEGIYICRPKHPARTNLFEECSYNIKILTDSATLSINKPTITSSTNGHAFEDENFSLDCTVEVDVGVMFTITWETPKNYAIKEKRYNISETTKETTSEGIEIGKSTITIYDASKEKDDGYYKCEVEDHSHNSNSRNFFVKVLGAKERYINLSEPTNHYDIIVSANKKKVRMTANFKGYPEPTLVWYNNKNFSISSTTTNAKYTIDISKDGQTINLYIKDVTLEDTGDYFLHATNGFVEKILKYKLFVKDLPKVQIDDIYIQAGTEARVQCKVQAYPEANIIWIFRPCEIKPKWPSCENERKIFQENEFAITFKDGIYKNSELKFTPSKPGIINCTAKNTIGITTEAANIFIGDLSEPVVAYGVSNTHKIGVDDEVSLTCGALAYNYSADLFWYRENISIENRSDLQILSTHTSYSYRQILTFKKIQHADSGLYECRAYVISGEGIYESKFVDVKVFDSFPPVIDTTNMEISEIEKNLGDTLMLECKALGIPKPIVSWFKDNNLINATRNDSNLSVEEEGTLLKIPFLRPKDEGIYKCQLSNRLGLIEKISRVKITNLPGLKLGWVIALGVILLILVLSIIFLCIKINRERKLRKELKAAGLAHFEEGAVECINPALSLDEQADLLPYNRRFEFPKEKLKLGKQLGAGAFGVVLKAVAEGIISDEKETTVAVKMVKKTADNEVMRALVSELKIMVHLGQHLNVVNLLGAVTKDIAKREIMVIVEYCSYGNLHNFLLKNRKRFINQINPKTDEIDPNITKYEQRWSDDYEYNSKSEFNTQGYVRQSEFDYAGSNVDSCNTEQTLISADGDMVLSNNSIQPVWRSNYKPDCTIPMDVTTTHLVNWAFQVARGMDYLASRKVLHGDLAARNILLCDENVVKICDFGLARTMYRNNYKKQGEAPLPIKWLAIESLGDQIFSTYSDVWSFGIVLWEFFSLAKVPYPGMEADQTLYLKLKDGYRMEKPEFANQQLYDIMLECWSANPESRPLFNVLEKKLAKMLEDEISNHYIDLNEPYLKMNTEYYESGQTDYLALMGCPDEPAPSAPRYVNGHIFPEAKIQGSSSDYLYMSPTSGSAIFSPWTRDDCMKNDCFTFPEASSSTISDNLDTAISKNRKKSGLPEEIPMLKHSYSGSETELSPHSIPSNNFSSLNAPKEDDIECRLQENGNYINKLLNESSVKDGTKDAFSNPSYLMLQTINETK